MLLYKPLDQFVKLRSLIFLLHEMHSFLNFKNQEHVPLCGGGGDGVGHVTHPMTAGGGISVAVAEGDHQYVSTADLEIQHAQKAAVACHEIQHDAKK